MPGFVLSAEQVEYLDLKTAGKVTIEYIGKTDGNGHFRGAQIIVDGFEFDTDQSCRENVTKAMAWARDVLATAVQSDVLVPGGHISSAVD